MFVNHCRQVLLALYRTGRVQVRLAGTPRTTAYSGACGGREEGSEPSA